MSLRRKIYYTLHSGKNSKLGYYTAAYLRMAVPGPLARGRLAALLRNAERRPDYAEMLRRRDYYCRLEPGTPLGPEARPLNDLTRTAQSVYWLDTVRYTRRFPQNLRLRLLPGDITYVPSEPSIVKTRPIGGDNANSVLMKLDRVRHFIFVDDHMSWSEKLPMAIFRGKVQAKQARLTLMERYFGHELVDAGDVCSHNDTHPEWVRPKLTLEEQMRYKFVLAIEGNDVASNLKWLMSSNSVAVMPRPRYESWFMEGTLKPGVHYIEVADDFSDLPDKISYYLDHPSETEEIIRNAHAYVAAFRDPRREDLVSLLTLRKYFASTGQL